jgi:acetyl-CoA carboxylase biotin carboxylase subunit
MAAAVAIGRAAGYTSAGTIEFLLDASGEFYFLEMNTRLQVEHPISEAVTGVDFVRAQIEIARGAKLSEMSAVANGHAIEVRVYAENPAEGFLPSPGRITHLRAPAGPGIRDDSGAYQGWTVPTAYDPLISKVVAWAPDRPGAIARMVRALTEYDVRGIGTTIGFCRDLVGSFAFASAEFDTTYVDRVLEENGKKDGKVDGSEEVVAIAAAIWEFVHRPSSIGDRQATEDVLPTTESVTTTDSPPATDAPLPAIRRWTMDDGRSTNWARRAWRESLR